MTLSPSPQHAASGPPAAPQDRRRGWFAAVRRGLSGLIFLGLGVLAWWWLTTHHFTGSEHDEPAPTSAQESGGAGAPAAVVVLTGSDARREISVVSVERRPLREHLTVPGRLDYDARSRLDYESPVDGIVSRMFVQFRQRVSKGESLAEVSSPDVGLARDEVRKREDDHAIARKEADWATTIADNVTSLLSALADHPPLDELERQFESRVLGDYREKLVGAYSRLLYVEKVQAGTTQLGQGGVLSGRIIEERTSNLEVARASFAAACEEANFGTRQDRDKAQAVLEQTERLVQVSTENLRTLVGSKLDTGAGDDSADAGPTGGTSISAIVLRTPFAGVVEEIFVSRGERVKSGERMFIVADTSNLWVRAQVHEKQWTTVEVGEGAELRVVVPGAAEHQTTAKVSHIGATVEADSRSVPIVAQIQNDDAHYKPGMFVWVELPQGETRDALAVPTPAVMRHEGQAFVFIPTGNDSFRRVDIDTGIEADDFVEVTRGLEAGQQVVSKGAFLLKSELLLEDEG